MDLRKSNGIELRNFYFTIQVLPNQVSKKSFYTFEDIDFLIRKKSFPKGSF